MAEFSVLSGMKNIYRHLTVRWLPGYCQLCQAPVPPDLENQHIPRLCNGCCNDLPIITTVCVQCGIPLHNTDNTHCGQCLQHPPAYQTSITPFYYAPPINQFITRLKFNRKLAYAALLGEQLIPFIQQHPEKLPECIIPVPLHPKRLRQRGFNQALEIARPIAKHFNLPLVTDICQRTRHTSPQMELDKQHRQQNIHNAFQVSAKCDYRHVAIIDDVVTTGCTVNELARVLAQTGVRKIQIWAAARATRL